LSRVRNRYVPNETLSSGRYSFKHFNHLKSSLLEGLLELLGSEAIFPHQVFHVMQVTIGSLVLPHLLQHHGLVILEVQDIVLILLQGFWWHVSDEFPISCRHLRFIKIRHSHSCPLSPEAT
jgi:hypothetical protein